MCSFAYYSTHQINSSVKGYFNTAVWQQHFGDEPSWPFNQSTQHPREKNAETICISGLLELLIRVLIIAQVVIHSMTENSTDDFPILL